PTGPGAGWAGPPAWRAERPGTRTEGEAAAGRGWSRSCGEGRAGSTRRGGLEAVNHLEEALLAEVPLLDDRLDVALQPLAVLAGDVLGGVDQDRDLGGVRIAAQGRHDFETVDLGHHQVQDDQVGLLLEGLFDA